MKKVVYILTLAVAMSLAACNTANESSVSKSGDASGDKAVTATSAANEEVASVQDSNVETSDVAAQPNASQPKMQPPKAPFTPEEAAKFKEGIELVKTYSDELNKCVDAKMSGKAIDEATKKRITEIQNQLDELEKAGKMNKKLIELKKVSDDVYNKIK